MNTTQTTQVEGADTAAGAAADIERLWREHAAGLRRYFLRRVGSCHDADDLVQEVFVRALRSAPATPGAGWVFTVARSVLTDHYRRAVHHRETPIGVVPDDQIAAPPAEHPNTAEAALARCVAQFLHDLPAEQAEAVHRIDMRQVRQHVAARQAGVSVSGMKSRVQRGRTRLRELVQACCETTRDARGGVLDFRPRTGDCTL